MYQNKKRKCRAFVLLLSLTENFLVNTTCRTLFTKAPPNTQMLIFAFVCFNTHNPNQPRLQVAQFLSMRTQTYFRLSLLFSGEKRQPEIRLRSQATSSKASRSLLPRSTRFRSSENRSSRIHHRNKLAVKA